MSKNIRLDQYLLNYGFSDSIKESQALIMCGNVLVNETKILKSGHPVKDGVKIRLLFKTNKYVSRGGEKLEGILSVFEQGFENKIILDIGLSTGGFSDLALQKGAKCVLGVDVSYGIVAEKLRQDSKMVIFEKINARNLTKEILINEKYWKNSVYSENRADIVEKISLVVMDVSFISVLKVLPAIKNVLSNSTDLFILIKPQFESEKNELPDGGVITDEFVIEKINSKVKRAILDMGFNFVSQIQSPIKGQKGNQESFFWLKYNAEIS